jgi:hypothetical protein
MNGKYRDITLCIVSSQASIDSTCLHQQVFHGAVFGDDMDANIA